jgi:hypothetical protein
LTISLAIKGLNPSLKRIKKCEPFTLVVQGVFIISEPYRSKEVKGLESYFFPDDINEG